MPKQNIEYTVTRSFNNNVTTLLESIIEYMDDEGVCDADAEPPNSDSRNLL